MIKQYLIHLKKLLSPEPYNILFGDAKFSKLEQIFEFCRIYSLLISNEGFLTFKQKRQYKKIPSNNPLGKIFFSRKTSELYYWFISRLDLRISDDLVNEKIGFLIDSGFTKKGIIDLFFLIVLKVSDKEDWYYRINYSRKQLLSSASMLIKNIKKLNKEAVKTTIQDYPIIFLKFFFSISSEKNWFDSDLGKTQISSFLDYNRIFVFLFDWDSYFSQRWFIKEKVNSRYISEGVTLSIFDRIKVKNDRLFLFFIDDFYGDEWFTVDINLGAIYTESKRTNGYHFALKKFGKSWSKIHRGSCDIILGFYKNAIANIAQIDSDSHLNRYSLNEDFRYKINDILDKFLKQIEPSDLKGIRKITKRYALQWKIYSILKRYKKNSIEVYRLRLFYTTFPSLFHIVFPDFLNDIIKGKPLKKNIPYWSSLFRIEAQKKSKNYRDAHKRLMNAIALNLFNGKENKCNNTMKNLKLIGLILPFFSIPDYKYNYLRWMVNNPEASDYFSTYYDFINSTQYSVTKYTTPKSLLRKHDYWVKENREIDLKKIDKNFPNTWFKDTWKSGSHCIQHVKNQVELQALSLDQDNCVYTYAERIYYNTTQIYRMLESDQIIATIEVKYAYGKCTVGQCLGKRNIKLNDNTMNIIQNWFQEFKGNFNKNQIALLIDPPF